jgi:CubicO group peptidase (beta-lactamase class C family)
MPEGARMRVQRIVLAGVVVTAFAACSGGERVAAPSGVGEVNTRLLDSAFIVARQQTNLTSLVVARGGTVERQEYFNGGGAAVPQDVRSVTKSVVSLLVGIALDRGCLRSLDQTLGELLGSAAPTDAAKRAITLRQLLTMTSGLGGDELANVALYNQWAAAPDQLTYVWDLPLVATPGAQFNYYSPGYYVVSRILTANCSQSTADLARDALFTPLGIGARAWEADDRGYLNGGAGLSLTPLDMVAIGNLVLANGQAATARVVSAAWIQTATATKVATSAMPVASGYGYGWWTGNLSGAALIMATGWGGQFIVIVPSKQLVVTAATRWQGVGTVVANAQWSAVADIITQRVVRAF